MLADRYVRSILEDGLTPGRILAISFKRDAASLIRNHKDGAISLRLGAQPDGRVFRRIAHRIAEQIDSDLKRTAELTYGGCSFIDLGRRE